MAFVVTENCIKCKYMDCVEVCPVDCFHEGPNFLVIDPDECIDCTLCEPECPVEAIFSEEEMPAGQEHFKQLNAELAKKWPVISEKKDAPADAKQWEGEPGQVQAAGALAAPAACAGCPRRWRAAACSCLSSAGAPAAACTRRSARRSSVTIAGRAAARRNLCRAHSRAPPGVAPQVLAFERCARLGAGERVVAVGRAPDLLRLAPALGVGSGTRDRTGSAPGCRAC